MREFVALPVILLLVLKMLNTAQTVYAKSLYREPRSSGAVVHEMRDDPDPLGRSPITADLIERRRDRITRQYWTERFNRENREFLSRLFNFPDSVTYRQYLDFLQSVEMKGIKLEQKPDSGTLDYIRDEIVRKQIITKQLRGNYMTRAEFEENKDLFGSFDKQQHYTCTAYNLEYRVKRYIRECIKIFYHDNENLKNELISVLNNDICDAIERHVKFGFMGNGENRFSILLSELEYGVFIMNERFVLVIPPEFQVITCSLLNRDSLESFPKGNPLAAFIGSMKNNYHTVRKEIRQLFINDRHQNETSLGQREIAMAGGLEFLKEFYGLGTGRN